MSDVEQIVWSPDTFADLVERAAALAGGPGRRILGIAGAPASGKSTLAVQVSAELDRRAPGTVTLLGMDAFHLAQRILDRRGQADIKGAPQTFDALGYLRTLERIRNTTETVYAPEFDRGQEDSIAAAVEIGPQIRLVITEGNYLLLDEDPWQRVAALLDQTWYVHLDDAVRQERLLGRHLSFGHAREAAHERTFGSDQRNAELITRAMLTPDLWIEHVVARPPDRVG